MAVVSICLGSAYSGGGGNLQGMALNRDFGAAFHVRAVLRWRRIADTQLMLA